MMGIAHVDVDSRLVGRIQQEFGTIKNLVSNMLEPTDHSFRIWKRGKERYGVNVNDFSNLITINRGGFYHHLAKFFVEIYKDSFPDLAFVYVDQHLDFDDNDGYGNFVGKIVHELRIPVYVLAESLNTDRLETKENEGLLIKIFTADQDIEKESYRLDDHTKYCYVDEIDENKVYLSTDTDAFSDEIFVRSIFPDSKESFSLEVYKQQLGQVLKDKTIVAADFTGIILKGENHKLNDTTATNLIDLIYFVRNYMKF